MIEAVAAAKEIFVYSAAGGNDIGGAIHCLIFYVDGNGRSGQAGPELRDSQKIQASAS